MDQPDSFFFSLANLPDAANWVRKQAGTCKLWCFQGEMGSGKTTLIREICRQLGVTGEISSPTFSLVNEYYLADGTRIFHFDFFRIMDTEEVYDIGFETYFDSGFICLIEWPGKIRSILEREPHLIFNIEEAGEGRMIRCLPHPATNF